MTPEQEKINLLYIEHDHLESILIMRQKRGMDLGEGNLWAIHDELEREIIAAESKLAYEEVKELRAQDPGVEH